MLDPPLCHGGDDFDFHQELRLRKPWDLDQGRGRIVALVEGATGCGAVLAPVVDAEHPRGFLHRAGRRRPGGAQDVADVLVDLLRLTPPVAHAGYGAVGVVGDLTGQVEQSAPVDDHSLVEVTRIALRVELLEQRLSLRAAGGVGQTPHDQSGRRGTSGAEELGALRPSAGVVRLEVGDIDELLDGIVEFRPRVGQDAFETLEGATGLGRHPAGDEVAVRISSGQSGGEQHSREGDADSGHEAASLLDRTLGENLAAIHGSSSSGRAPLGAAWSRPSNGRLAGEILLCRPHTSQWEWWRAPWRRPPYNPGDAAAGPRAGRKSFTLPEQLEWFAAEVMPAFTRR